MSTWKKALSAAVTAALVASLTASAAFATKGTSGQSDQTDHLACTNAVIATLATCSQVADGISTVTLTGDPTDDAAGKSLYISAAGATIIGATGDFVLAGGIVTDADPINLVSPADAIVLRAPSAAGSAVVSVYEITTATGIAALEGTLTITFTATSGLDVSAANSVVKTLNGCGLTSGSFNGTAVKTAPAGDAGDWSGAYLCVLVKDGNGTGVAGAVVSATITPVGLLSGDFYGQTTTATTDANGVVWIGIYSSGLAGTATIGTSATINSKTTSFTPVTFTFSGTAASITASSLVLAVWYNLGQDHAVEFTAKDAAGNNAAVDGDDTVSSDTSVLTIEHVDEYDGDPLSPGEVLVECQKVGSATVTVKQGSVASNAVKVYCSDEPDSFTIAFDKTTVAPGGSATITVTVLDENGQPAYIDGEDASLVVSSGAFIPSSPEEIDYSTSSVDFTFLAPFAAGTVTALASVDGITGNKSTQINVGAVAPAVFTFNVTGTALGNTMTGPFTSSTKISTGGYITWRFDGGAAAANKTIQIWAYKKVGLSTNPWSAPYLLTTRVTNASGVAFANITSGSVIWLSIRPVLAATATEAAVWGPWSIGRWVR